jgi:P-type Cu2+ transporter
LGELHLLNPGALDGLSAAALQHLRDLSSRSNHPRSRALARALPAGPLSAAATVLELPGQGMELRAESGIWRLGRADFAISGGSEGLAPDRGTTVLTHRGQVLAAFEFEERTRGDLPALFADLRSRGISLSVLSGDAQGRVDELVDHLGLTPAAAHGGMSPTAKAEWITANSPETLLMVGDGLNDALAFEAAGLSATPAIDRPGLPARADFYFLGEDLGAVARALAWARQTDAVQRRSLRIALSYNAVALSLALGGLMSPLFAAILMPISSLIIVADTVLSQRRLDPR